MERVHPQFIQLARRRQGVTEARRLGNITEERLQTQLARIAEQEAGTERTVATEAVFRQTFDRERGLTDAESEALTQAILECPCPPVYRYLHILLEAWARCVRKVEAGYNLDWEEYSHDIALRSYLQRIVGPLHPRARSKLMEAIAPLDQRFGAVTQPSRMMEADSDRSGDAWWWKRVLPQHPGPKLVESMQTFYNLDPEYRPDPH